MSVRKSCWTKACSGVTHSHRRSCVASEVIPPRCWFCEPPRPRTILMSSNLPSSPCQCNPSQPGGKPGCSCHQSEDCACCPNVSCDEQKQPCNDSKIPRYVYKTPPPSSFPSAPLALEESMPEYPCKTCPAEAAKLARNEDGSLQVITCSECCMKDVPDLCQDDQNSAKIQTDSVEEAQCGVCLSKQTSTPNASPECPAKKSENIQYEKQCPETCLSKLAASTSCENWTELVKDLVKENLKSLLDIQCECADNCSMKKISSKRNLKDAPAATNSIPTCDQSTFVTVGRVESSPSLEISEAKEAKPARGLPAEACCTVDCQIGTVCSCRYPPAYKQVGCTGLITGTCECGKHC